jgi:glycosyltransferase involved in cell wall biosynthesis
VKITVIICTCNRSQSLARTLTSLAAQTLPERAQWEVLVVDNNSTDQTREVVQDFSDRYPGRFRYLRESRPGKSFALNSGVQAAAGDVLAFTDDDVRAEPQWLQSLTSGLESGAWAGAGGRVLAEWAGSQPRWLPSEGRYSMAPLALFDRGEAAGELEDNPFGVNMAFRKAMFEKYGGFRTDLGPRAGSSGPQKNEDAEFGRRLLQAGERFRYEPEAAVYHHVPENRLRKEYFLAWWFDKARSDVYELGNTDGGARIWGVPVHLFRRLVVATLRWIVAARSSHRFYRKIQVWYLAGEIVASYRQSLEAKTAKTKRECDAPV